MSIEMRKVKYYELVRNTVINGYQRELKGEASFHQFGIDFYEFESGAGNFSTAIIELPDGTVKNIHLEDIEFIKE